MYSKYHYIVSVFVLMILFLINTHVAGAQGPTPTKPGVATVPAVSPTATPTKAPATSAIVPTQAISTTITTSGRILPRQCSGLEDGKPFILEINGTATFHLANGTLVIYECTWDDSTGAHPNRTEKSPLEIEWEGNLSVLWVWVKVASTVALALGVLAMSILAAIALFHVDFFKSVRESIEATPNWLMGPIIFGSIMSVTVAQLKVTAYSYLGVWTIVIVMAFFAKRQSDKKAREAAAHGEHDEHPGTEEHH